MGWVPFGIEKTQRKKKTKDFYISKMIFVPISEIPNFTKTSRVFMTRIRTGPPGFVNTETLEILKTIHWREAILISSSFSIFGTILWFPNNCGDFSCKMATKPQIFTGLTLASTPTSSFQPSSSSSHSLCMVRKPLTTSFFGRGGMCLLLTLLHGLVGRSEIFFLVQFFSSFWFL